MRRRRPTSGSTASPSTRPEPSSTTRTMSISMTRIIPYDEHRYIIIGRSQQGRLLLVSYTERGETLRLISSREVTPAERRAYEEG